MSASGNTGQHGDNRRLELSFTPNIDLSTSQTGSDKMSKLNIESNVDIADELTVGNGDDYDFNISIIRVRTGWYIIQR